MAKFKTGIIGCGGIANGKHMPALSRMADVEMVAFCDIIPDRAVEARNKYGTPDAKVYTDYRELLADPEIDNVRVLTNNRMHAEITIAALDAGKNVICEKPMSVTAEEGRAMLEARDRSGKVLAIGYQHKFDADVIYAREESQAGELGEIYHGKCQVLRRRGAPTWGVFMNKEEQGAGPLYDVATHALDTLLYIMDNYSPKSVLGVTHDKLKNLPDAAHPFGMWDPEKYTVEDSAFGLVTMKNGASIIVETSWLINAIVDEGVRYSVCGTRAGLDNYGGKFKVNSVKHGKKILTTPDFAAGGVSFYNGASMSPVDMEQRNFFDAIEGKAELVNTPERAAVVTEILEAILISAETGKAVYFD